MDEQVSVFRKLLEQDNLKVQKIVSAIGDEGLLWAPDVPDTNSAAVLATHVFGSEAESVHEFIGGMPADRVRSREFTDPISTVAELIEMINRIGRRSQAALSNETDGSLTRIVDCEPGVSMSAHQLLIRVLTHNAEHIGHLELTEQLRKSRQR